MDLPVTYEAAVGEPLHPDASVRARLVEERMSTCPSGCKVYADPRSNLRVVGHNGTYGCR